MTNQPAPSDTPRVDAFIIQAKQDHGDMWASQVPKIARLLELEIARLSAEREKERSELAAAKHNLKGEEKDCDELIELLGRANAALAERDQQLAEANALSKQLAQTCNLHVAEKDDLYVQLADSQRQKAELEGLAKLRDEETARLEAEKTFMAKNITELVDERAELRARLAEADVSIPTAVKMQVSCFLNRDLQNDTTLGAVNELFREINSLRAKQLALESQCQRMRDALDALYNDSPEVREAVIEKYGIHHAPLDLELLNRVRDVLINILKSASPNKIENPAMYSAWRGAEELLKSLSPAP